jgi:putative N6-adenine-specific DNA methylase
LKNPYRPVSPYLCDIAALPRPELLLMFLMADWQRTSDILLSCPLHFPSILAAEAEKLGFPPVAKEANHVIVKGTLHDCMRLNLWLRTAHHVYYKLDEGRVENAEHLYRWAKTIAWEDYIDVDLPITVTAAVRNDTIRDHRFASLKLKDAIVDRMRQKFGRRPDSGKEKVGAVIFLHWQDDRASLFLDTSGEPLSKRGYRLNPGNAPMQETLAAAALLLAGWNGQAAFVNPMCGSGTLAIEAALIAMNKAPGALREDFAFMALKGFSLPAWKMIKTAAGFETRPPKYPVMLSDIDPKMVAISRRNADAAGVSQYLIFETADFVNSRVPDGPAMVAVNPEYGHRMGEDVDLRPMYKELGDWFKKLGGEKTAFMFAAHNDLIKNVGLRPDGKAPFLNGNIECRWLSFSIRGADGTSSTLFKTKWSA